MKISSVIVAFLAAAAAVYAKPETLTDSDFDAACVLALLSGGGRRIASRWHSSDARPPRLARILPRRIASGETYLVKVSYN